MAYLTADGLSFRVTKGPEALILKEHSEGMVYFATDTKKIYLDAADEKRLSMGGNTGIYYANVKFESSSDSEYFFSANNFEIDENTGLPMIPNLKDLILNTEDGCFYRVNEIYDETIKAIKLTVRGGGSEDSDGTPKGSISMKLYPDAFDKRPFKTIVAGSECKIPVIFTCKTAEGDRIKEPGRYEIRVGGTIVARGSLRQKQNEDDPEIINEIDITSITNLPGTYGITILCYGYNGGIKEDSTTRYITVVSERFQIAWKNNKTTEDLEVELNNLSNNFRLDWTVSGSLENIVTHIKIDENHFETTGDSFVLTPEQLKTYKIEHGAHRITIYAEHLADNPEDNLTTPEIVYNALFVEENNNNFIISCRFYKNTISQYETVQIPVLIYGKTNTNGTAQIDFEINGSPKAPKKNCANLAWKTFAYTPATSGFDSLTFTCGTTSIKLLLNVLSANLGIEEIDDYEFKFKATDFSTDEDIRAWTYNNQSIIFCKTEDGLGEFDWNNGGLQSGEDDPDNGPYFKIPAGSRVIFPYNLFSMDVVPSIGANFKIIFKAVNCQDYDAIFAKNKNSSMGLTLSAQGSEVKDSSGKTSKLRYCEDTYIEYEYDYIYDRNNKSEQYLVSWIDGIPSKITELESSSFNSYIANNEQGNVKLTIGSDDCDVYIYLIKFYNRHLTNREHLTNFIMDASTVSKMVDRRNRNDVYSEDANGNEYIDYAKVANNNPDCNIYIYEIPKIPTSKLDITDESGNDKCCKFLHYLGTSASPIREYEGVKLRAQGTSSMNYGVSAYNLDAKFPEKWAMDENAIPVDYFNTKVNVASCEEANNALNQEWYNRFQPYWSKKRLSDARARDTMQFKQGVLFLKDKNKVIDNADAVRNNVFKEIKGYVDNPYPRLYSICNMGNAKKNKEVFHGAGDPSCECCIENTNNNTAGHQMAAICGAFVQDVQTTEGPKEVQLEIPLNLPDNLFDEKGYVNPEVTDWGSKDIDIEVTVSLESGGTEIHRITQKGVSQKTLWQAGLQDTIFGFRYIKDEEDVELVETCSNNFLRLINWFVKNNPANAAYKTQADIEKLPEADREQYLLPEDKKILPVFKFKGVKGSGANPDYPTEREILGTSGISIPEQTFKYDCSEYRAAKMLRECEEYLIMDSIIYHYLFIERHTMADNVSKNTFWTTEDGIHWDLTKNYDNDTADGIDNNGDLLFDYGYEIGDRSGIGSSVFNDGLTASWINFIYYIPMTIKKYVYKILAERNAWKAANYLQLFGENWQDTIPEACWIESFYRKYFRPREVYDSEGYLSRLDNGKKTHQRKQYETYQEQYIDSKYGYYGSGIIWRSADPDENNKDPIYFDATLYADGYIQGEIAGVAFSQRAKKGQVKTISFPTSGSLGDATGYLYFPNLFTKFENVEQLKAQQLDLSSANKLKVLSLDAANFKDVSPERLEQLQSSILTSEKISGNRISLNKNIQELILKNCSNVNFAIDLLDNSRLKKVDLTGSTFTTVSMKNCPVSSVKLHNPIGITLSNLYNLDNTNFTIADYSRLTEVFIDNIDFTAGNKQSSKNLSKNIIKSIFEINSNANRLTYKLHNVGWDFVTGEVNDTDIPLLNTLLIQKPSNEVKTHSKALTGYGFIPNAVYDGDQALALYEKYGLNKTDNNSYPSFILNFPEKLYTITVKNGNGATVWSRKVASFKDLTNDLLTNGSYDGAFDFENSINKNADNDYIYYFNNKWQYSYIVGAEEKTGIFAGDEEGSYNYLDLSKMFEELSEVEIQNIKSDIIITPVYTAEEHRFTIEFKYSKNDTTAFHTAKAYFGAPFKDIAPNFIPFKNDSNLPLEKTYKLKGYTYDNSENITKPSIIDENAWGVKENAVLYPVFEEVSVYDVDYSQYLKITNNILKGLEKNDEGENIYQGSKLTIPTNVTYIDESAFQGASLKKVFTKDSHFIEIKKRAFYQSALEYFDFNNCTIEKIGTEAFRECKFKSSDYNYIINLPNGLTTIERHAFNQSGFIEAADNTRVIFKIPGSIIAMGENAVANFINAPMTVEIGSIENKSTMVLSLANSPVIHSNRNAISQKYTDIDEVVFYSTVYSDANPADELLLNNATNISLSYVQP